MRQRHMPLGYRMAGGKIVIDPEQAEIIKGIFQEYSEGASLYQIARKLTEQGALNANSVSYTHLTLPTIRLV